MAPVATQIPLFASQGSAVESASPRAEDAAAAERLPERIRIGTSSWSFPGWAGSVWRRDVRAPLLARHGLAAYARHPLLRAVGIDRSYYAPPDAETFARYAAAVPAGFRFLVKAHQHVTCARLPAPGGRSEANPRFLDAGYAADAVVAPAVAGLGSKLGALVFQFPPQDPAVVGGPQEFAERLHRFLGRLPRGPAYAVEIRTEAWFTPAYVQALRDSGAVHCLALHPRLPDLDTQQTALAPDARLLVARWMLRRGLRYEQARERYAPFDRLAEPDPRNRERLAGLLARTAARGAAALVTVNNKAEGSAPLSVFALARRTADLLDAAP